MNGSYTNGEARVAIILQIIVALLMIYVPRLVEPDLVSEINTGDIPRALYRLGFINLALMIIANQATIFMRLAGLFAVFRMAYYTTTVAELKYNRNRAIMTFISIIMFAIYGLVITVLKTPDWQSTYPFYWCWQTIGR